MTNENKDLNQNDIYVDDPNQGRSREHVVETKPQEGTTGHQNVRPSELTASTTREQALQASAQKREPGSFSSGQQNIGSSDSSGVGGYGMPENGFGRDAGGGFVEPKGGYNQAAYNQQGTYSESQGDLRPRNDGQQDTFGSGYDQQQSNPDMAQRGYDPEQSGTQSAQNTPGEVVDTPGRDTGSSWGEAEQMGTSTDTANRKNPSA